MSEKQKQKALAVTKTHIDALKPVALAHDKAVAAQFINKFVQMYRVPVLEAQRFYDREKDNFSKLVSQSDALRKCTPMSLYFAFMKVGALRLTFDNGREPLVYLIPGNRNIGTKDNPKWISEVVAQPSPLGEREIRINAGILKDVGHPYIVHEGDIYKEKFNHDTGEMEVLEFEPLGKTQKIIGSFIRLVNPDGKVVYKTFKPVDWARWEAASAKKNRGVANALYTAGVDKQIDESFLRGKTLLHAFKGYKQVDFAYSKPASFEPDNDAAAQLNEGYLDDIIDTEYEDETPEHKPADDFQQAIEAEQETPKESVKVEVKGDDELFN